MSLLRLRLELCQGFLTSDEYQDVALEMHRRSDKLGIPVIVRLPNEGADFTVDATQITPIQAIASAQRHLAMQAYPED